MPKTKNLKIDWIKGIHADIPDRNFFLPKEDKKLIAELSKQAIFGKDCQKVCTKVIDLLPATLVDAHSGVVCHAN